MDSAILPQLTELQKTLPKPSSAVAILSAVKTLFLAAIQRSVLFGSVRDQTIGRCLHNLTKLYLDYK